MSGQVDLLTLARACGWSIRTAKRVIAAPGWPAAQRAGTGGRASWAVDELPETLTRKGCEIAVRDRVNTALLLREHRERPVEPLSATRHSRQRQHGEAQLQSAWRHYERLTNVRKNEAKRRQRAVLAVEALIRGGETMGAARALVAAQLQRDGVRGGSNATLGRWMLAVKGAPRDAWVALLAPSYSGRQRTAELAVEAWDFYKGDWLRLEQPTAQACYARLQRVAAGKGWVVPSLKTLMRRMDRELPPQVQVLARQGEEELMKMYPAQERDRTAFSAVEAVNADGHKFDVFVKFGDGTVGRPMMVGVQCLGSGKLLGWRVGQTESADLARMAFADVVKNYGIPRKVWLDNGRGFASKMLTGGTPNRFRFKVLAEDPVGILVGLGCQIHWATPYHGQAKPIERAWRDLCDRVAKHPAFAGAYTGNNPTAKPENYGSKAVPVDDFLAVLATEIAEHNARPGRRSKACGGKLSFDAVFAASYATHPVRKATIEQLRGLLLAADVGMASRADGSVRLAGNRYWTEALTPLAGQRVMVRFDPDNLHTSVAVYSMAGVFVGDAACIAAVGFADHAAATEHARGRNQYRRAAKLQLVAERRMDAARVAAQLPSVAPSESPETSVTQGLFGKVNPHAAVAQRRPADTSADDCRALDLMMFAQIKKMKAEAI